MRRRQLLALLAGAAAIGPHFVFAQPSGPKTIGFLGLTSAEPNPLTPEVLQSIVLPLLRKLNG